MTPIARSAANAQVERHAPGKDGGPFGRAREQRTAREWLRRVANGRKGLILIGGPRGAGKTELLADISRTASGQGFQIVRAPFSHYRSLLLAETLLRDLRPYPARRRTPEAVPADLVEKFVAHRRTRIDRAAPPDGVRPPVLVALDDIAWNDPLVQRCLPGLLGASGSRRVLWLLAGVSPATASPPVPRGCVYAERLTLGLLELRDALRMAADRLGAAPDAMLGRVVEACGGHPGLLDAVLEAVIADGRLRVRDGIAGLTTESVPRAVLASLLEADPRLSARGRALICALVAGGGEALRIGEFTRTGAEGSTARLEALREVVDAGILDIDDSMLRFRHALVRQGAEQLLARSGQAKAPARACATRMPRTAATLSPTERSIVRLVASGLTNGQIATRISLSPHTVNFHLRKIFHKAGVSSRVELAGVHRQLLLADD